MPTPRVHTIHGNIHRAGAGTCLLAYHLPGVIIAQSAVLVDVEMTDIPRMSYYLMSLKITPYCTYGTYVLYGVIYGLSSVMSYYGIIIVYYYCVL